MYSKQKLNKDLPFLCNTAYSKQKLNIFKYANMIPGSIESKWPSMNIYSRINHVQTSVQSMFKLQFSPLTTVQVKLNKNRLELLTTANNFGLKWRTMEESWAQWWTWNNNEKMLCFWLLLDIGFFTSCFIPWSEVWNEQADQAWAKMPNPTCCESQVLLKC